MHSYYQDLASDCCTSFFPVLWPLIYAKILFPLYMISWEPIDRISPNFIYAFILTWSTLSLLHVIFPTFVPELRPLIYAEISFCSISWEQIDIISPKFLYAFILTRSSLGLLHVIFPKFEPKLWPLNYAKLLFPLNSLKAIWQNPTKFYKCIDIDKT